MKLKHLSLLTNDFLLCFSKFLHMEALNTHFTDQNSFAAMLDRQVAELTNHREVCSICAGLPVIGQEIQWVDE